MESHCGRCYSNYGKCYCHCGRWNGHIGWMFFFILSSEMLKQNLIPYVRQMVFVYVFVKGWTIDSYIYSFFYQSHEVLVLPPHYTEIFQCDGMTCDVEMIIYWGRVLQCSLNLSPDVLEDSHIYSSSHSTLSHLNL